MPSDDTRRLRIAAAPAVVMAFSLLAGCAYPAPEPERADKALQDGIAACSDAHHFDPRSGDLPERALAPGEREWRECVQQAVLTNIIPQSSVVPVYRALIRDDERMTDAIAAGSMTRAERSRRLDASLAAIRVAEARAERERQKRQMQALQTELDRQRRQREIDRIVADAAQQTQRG